MPWNFQSRLKFEFLTRPVTRANFGIQLPAIRQRCSWPIGVVGFAVANGCNRWQTGQPI